MYLAMGTPSSAMSCRLPTSTRTSVGFTGLLLGLALRGCSMACAFTQHLTPLPARLSASRAGLIQAVFW